MKNIFLLPYGGGSASSYRSYVHGFPRNVGYVVPVEIPGRGKRSHEEYAKSIRECAALALQQIDTTSERYILHGHCMGALLAFEAIKLIEAAGRQLPSFMVASGRNAPRHVNDWLRRVGGLDDRSLFKELQELGGVPRGLSFAMAQHFLTVIRNDQAMSRDYDPGETRISVPILALAGRDDKMTNAAALAEWEDYTSKFLSIEWLDGQHYFILDQPDRVALYVEEFCKSVDSLAVAEGH
ncbi:MAG TPA: alpha/beta fold hydrolase [Bryobacteraceae bacterium]|jgi:surfactin synthase thioesterase subunit|nr:alpha/beta fold hydrolase [Bryobacteraceae bacterium]